MVEQVELDDSSTPKSFYNLNKMLSEEKHRNASLSKMNRSLEELGLPLDTNPFKNTDSSSKVLNSEITKNGYNLIDENKNVKFELLKTSNPTIFIAKKGNVQGVFTLNGMSSKFESYQNNELVVEKVEVKY